MMDLILLGLHIKRDAETYKSEFYKQIDMLNTLINLPKVPIKQVKPILAFVVKNVWRYKYESNGTGSSSVYQPLNIKYSEIFQIIYNSLHFLDRKSVHAILNEFITLRQKEVISSAELFKYFLLYDFNNHKCKEFLDLECYNILVEWFKKGTDKQKRFSYYYLLLLFNKVHKEISKNGTNSSNTLTIPVDELESLICSAFFCSKKLSKFCMLYFLNETDIEFDISKIKNGKVVGMKIYEQLNSEHFDRDEKIMKIRIFNLFKEHFNINHTLTEIIINMINNQRLMIDGSSKKDGISGASSACCVTNDITSTDLTSTTNSIPTLLKCLVDSVDKKELESTLRRIGMEFISENNEDEIVAYGLNVIRCMYVKIFRSDIIDEMEDSIDHEEISQDGECVKSEDIESSTEKINSNSINLDGGNVIPDKLLQTQEEMKFYKNIIFDIISPFKGNRNKTIFHSYKSVINVLVKSRNSNRTVEFIKKHSTKEEKERLRKKGQELKKNQAEEKVNMFKLKISNKKGKKFRSKNSDKRRKILMAPNKKKCKKS